MNALNTLRLQRSLKYEHVSFLNGLVEQIAENLNDLDISGIFNILHFEHQAEDDLYQQIYEGIQENLFNSITEDGESLIDVKVLFDCFEKISLKKQKIKRPSNSDFEKLLQLFSGILKNDQSKEVNYVSKQMAFMIQEDYLPIKFLE